MSSTFLVFCEYYLKEKTSALILKLCGETGKYFAKRLREGKNAKNLELF